jgi:transposase
MQNLNLFPEIDIPEKDLQSTPKSVRDFLLFIVEEHRFLLEQVTTLVEEKNSLVRTVEELKTRLGKNSSNSNKPPSSDNPFGKDRDKNQKEKEQKRKPGAKPGHEWHRQRLLPPTYEQPVEPTVCSCGCTEFKTVVRIMFTRNWNCLKSKWMSGIIF